jgi:hypothetical protein
MHTQPVGSPLTGRAASGRSARRACVTRPGRRRQGPGVDEIAQEGTDAFAALQGEAARVPAACLPIMLILTRYGPRVAVRPSARPVTVRPALPQPRPGTRRAGPIDRRFRSRSTTWPVPGDDRGPIAVAYSGGCPACRGGASKAIPAGQNQAKAPPRMRWRGLARPRRTGWLVAWPCWHSAPPAGARYPCEGPVSRLLPRSRGRPRVMPVSER